MLLAPSLAWATAETLYVRPSADCATNGNGRAYACATVGGGTGAWSKLSNVLMNATDETVGQLDPGDTLKVCGNFVVADRKTANYHLFFTVSGTSGNVITVEGDCTAEGGSATADFYGGTSTLYGTGTDLQHDITLRHLVIHEFASRGLLLYNNATTDEVLDKHLTVEDVTIRDIRGAGKIGLDARGRFITITRVTIARVGDDAIHHAGHHLTVQDSTISGVSLDSGNSGDGIQATGESDGNQFLNNTIDMTSVDSKYCIIDEGITDLGSVIVRGNRCTRNAEDVVGSGFRIQSVGTATSISQNTVIGGELGIQFTSNTGTAVMYGNLIYAQSHDCINVGGTGAGSVVVSNNTCANPKRNGIQNNNTGGVVATFTNNLLVGGTTCLDKRAANTESYNVLFGCVTLVSNSGTPTTTGTGDLLSNPLLTQTYQLGPGSPARRAGTAITPCIDVRGTACMSPPDIGAYQSFSTADDVTAPTIPSGIRVR